MAKVTKKLAEQIAPKLHSGSFWVECRDDVNFASSDELDGFQLDMLTDMAIAARKSADPEFVVNP